MVIIPREWAHEAAEAGQLDQRIGPVGSESVDKIHSLIQEYCDTHPLVCGGDPREREQECIDYVKMHYGLTGFEFIVWSIISGVISWLVKQLLQRLVSQEHPS